MPPPTRPNHTSDSQPSAAASSLQSQVAGLAGSLRTIAEVARADSSHFRKAGEGAEPLGKAFGDLNGALVRGVRDLVVATHFASESVVRSARDREQREYRALGDRRYQQRQFDYRQTKLENDVYRAKQD